MTVITEAIDEAIALCGRPDERGNGINYANAAIAKIVRSTTWPFDRLEVALTFADTTSYTQRIVIATSLPKFRKLNYIRSPSGKLYTQRDPSSVVSPCGTEYLPSFYITGTDILLKDEVPVSELAVGYYQQAPRLVEIPANALQSNTHWTLDIAYQALVYGIMAEVYSATGDDTSYGVYENKFRFEVDQVARDFKDIK